jgi:hypothetical protein
VAGKVLLDVLFRRVFVQEHADLVLGDFEVFPKPPPDLLRIVDAGLEIPDL